MYECHKRFREGCTNIEDDVRSVRFDKSREKVMVEMFFNYVGVIHYEFNPEGQTLTNELFLEILKQLRDVINYLKNEQEMIGFFYAKTFHHIVALIGRKYFPRCSVTRVPSKCNLSETLSLFSRPSTSRFLQFWNDIEGILF